MKLPAYLMDNGKMAHFLIPLLKIDNAYFDKTVRTHIQEFLLKTFGGYTEDPMVWGVWKDGSEKIYREASIRFTVSFKGEDLVLKLIEFLSHLLGQIDEDCIYLEMGDRSFYVYPHNEDARR